MGAKILIICLLTLQTAGPSSTRMRTIDLYSDNRAYRVNDIVTVIITESSSASEEANTTTGKKTSLQARVSALWNNNIAGKVFGKSEGSVDYPSMNVTSDMNFDGNGRTTRKGTFTAQVAAIVLEVLPNGNLVIEGKRTILVNQEKKNITVSGIIRPEDVAPDNTVRSTMIADAQITYNGDGPITAKAKQGFLFKFFDWIPIF